MKPRENFSFSAGSLNQKIKNLNSLVYRTLSEVKETFPSKINLKHTSYNLGEKKKAYKLRTTLFQKLSKKYTRSIYEENIALEGFANVWLCIVVVILTKHVGRTYQARNFFAAKEGFVL